MCDERVYRRIHKKDVVHCFGSDSNMIFGCADLFVYRCNLGHAIKKFIQILKLVGACRHEAPYTCTVCAYCYRDGDGEAHKQPRPRTATAATAALPLLP